MIEEAAAFAAKAHAGVFRKIDIRILYYASDGDCLDCLRVHEG